jgi:hypothetical protein
MVINSNGSCEWNGYITGEEFMKVHARKSVTAQGICEDSWSMDFFLWSQYTYY